MNALTTQTVITKTHGGDFGPLGATTVYRLHARGVYLGLLCSVGGVTRAALSRSFGSQMIEADTEEEALALVEQAVGISGERTLQVSAGSFDQETTFTLEVEGYRGKKSITCKVFNGYEKEGDGVLWALNTGACIKSHYTAADTCERDRLNVQTPVRHGDVVTIGGEKYTVEVLGDYSNAAIFNKVGA